MRPAKRNGVAMLLALLAISLVGAFMFVLARGSHSIMVTAGDAYCQAAEANLVASGLAWARHNGGTLANAAEGLGAALDVSALNIPHAFLRVAPVKSAGPGIVRIDTRCRSIRITAKSSGTYYLDAGR